jgi:hypothetical protein
MKVLLLSLFLLGGALIFPGAYADDPSTNLPELSNLLALFSAQANSADGIRINWTLDQQSPLISAFRLYRGYEEVGNFAVLMELPVRRGKQIMEYSFTDTSARGGVSYYYKIAALGQKSESVFPVVITATRPRAGEKPDARELAPVAIVRSDKIALYVRHAGHVKLEIVLPRKTLVDDNLQPGIYEFDTPSGARAGTRLHLEHDQDYRTDVTWPVN